MSKLIPAILEKNEAEVFKKVEILRKIGLTIAHLDVMDGLAVPNKCVGGPELASRLDIDLEIHLMVKNPLEEAKKYLELKNVVRIIVRSEELANFDEYSKLLKESEKIGLAIDPETQISEKLVYLLDIGYLLIMGVNSGFSGQSFIPSVLTRIVLARSMWPKILIGIDGGMNERTIPMVKKRGFEIINAASYFWGGNKEEIIKFVEGD